MTLELDVLVMTGVLITTLALGCCVWINLLSGVEGEND